MGILYPSSTALTEDLTIIRNYLPSRIPTLYMELWIELTGRRAMLMQALLRDENRDGAVESPADPADQAALEQEQERIKIEKMRLRQQLREIDKAIELMERDAYGLCLMCKAEIPIPRLRVQPAALLCVPCRTQEEEAALTIAERPRRPGKSGT